MFLSYLRNPFFRFISVAAGLYLLWYFAYEYYLKPFTLFDDYIINSLVNLGETLLKWLGYELIPYQDFPLKNHIGIVGPEGPLMSKGVTIGAPCDGAVLFALFVAFVIAFPGKIKHKLWFIPAGVLAIHLFNVMRVAALAIVVFVNEDWLAFNHDYTFTIIVYSFVFFLWWIWTKKFGQTSDISKPR